MCPLSPNNNLRKRIIPTLNNNIKIKVFCFYIGITHVLFACSSLYHNVEVFFFLRPPNFAWSAARRSALLFFADFFFADFFFADVFFAFSGVDFFAVAAGVEGGASLLVPPLPPNIGVTVFAVAFGLADFFAERFVFFTLLFFAFGVAFTLIGEIEFSFLLPGEPALPPAASSFCSNEREREREGGGGGGGRSSRLLW